jgi:hypothetical protein
MRCIAVYNAMQPTTMLYHKEKKKIAASQSCGILFSLGTKAYTL